MVKRLTLIVTAVVLTCFSSPAQREKIPFFKKVTHPFMPPITSEYFFFSEDGLMWFSTAQGLTSFDGSEITFYSSLQQANEMGLNRINGFGEDRNHDFYVATPTTLCFYDRQKRVFRSLSYTFADAGKKYDNGFSCLYIDNDGLVYAGSAENGLFIYDPGKNKFQHFNLDPGKPDNWKDLRLNTVVCFARHSTDPNQLWVGTYHGIYLFNKKNKTFERRFELINPGRGLPGTVLPEHYDIQKMEIEDDSTIWFNSWTGGIGKYNTHTGKVKLFLHDVRINSPEQSVGFVIPKFGRLGNSEYLLGIYDDKTAIFNSRTEKVTYFRVSETSFPQEQTRYVTNDRHGNLWLLQKGSIYAKLPDSLRLQSVIIPHLSPVKFTEPTVRGVYFDTSSHLFYITMERSVGVHVYDTNFNQQKILPSVRIHNYYTFHETIDVGITRDGSGRFWTAGWKNSVLTPGDKQFRLIETKYPSVKKLQNNGQPWDVATTRKGNILYKISGSLIYHIDHNSLAIDTIRCPAMNPGKTVRVKEASAWYDSKRDLVYLTRDDGIAQYNLSERKMRVIPNLSIVGGLPSDVGICAPTLDAAGRMCVMLSKFGLRWIDPESLECTDSVAYGTRGLIRGDYTAIIGGNNEYVLLRSRNGTVIYDYRKKQSFLFDQSNGLSSPDNKSFLYANGHLILGQAGRFDYYKLSGLDNYSTAVTPYLSSIVIDTNRVYGRTGSGNSQTIMLDHQQNAISFSFSASEFFFPERIEYAYKLVPLDQDWHYANYFNRKVVYSRLSPGKYTFLLKAQMQGGNWNTVPVGYTIIIKPAWWQTKLFTASLLISILLAVILLAKWRIRKIRLQEREKLQMEKQILELEARALRAQMNPHFIFNCINSIKSLIQEEEKAKSVTYLTIFSKLIRTLFNNADKKEISLYDEIETCKYYLQLEAMRFDTKFAYSVTIDPDIDLKSIQVPALIIQPFIENAIWHGIVPRNGGGHVWLHVANKEGSIEIVIEDDGIGREASRQNRSASKLIHQSKGVNLTQTRLELNNLLQQRQAQLEIVDKKDVKGVAAGTRVVIRLKEEFS